MGESGGEGRVCSGDGRAAVMDGQRRRRGGEGGGEKWGKGAAHRLVEGAGGEALHGALRLGTAGRVGGVRAEPSSEATAQLRRTRAEHAKQHEPRGAAAGSRRDEADAGDGVGVAREDARGEEVAERRGAGLAGVQGRNGGGGPRPQSRASAHHRSVETAAEAPRRRAAAYPGGGGKRIRRADVRPDAPCRRRTRSWTQPRPPRSSRLRGGAGAARAGGRGERAGCGWACAGTCG